MLANEMYCGHIVCNPQTPCKTKLICTLNVQTYALEMFKQILTKTNLPHVDWSLSGDSLSRPFGLDLGPPYHSCTAHEGSDTAAVNSLQRLTIN